MRERIEITDRSADGPTVTDEGFRPVEIHDQKGRKLFVEASDAGARMMATAGLIAGFIGGAGGVASYIHARNLKLESEKTRAHEHDPTLNHANLVGDCNNENVLRTALGVNPIGLEGCIQERMDWLEQGRDELEEALQKVSGQAHQKPDTRGLNVLETK